MNVTELVIQEARSLPLAKAREVLDFYLVSITVAVVTNVYL
jgi:hypothetical protein